MSSDELRSHPQVEADQRATWAGTTSRAAYAWDAVLLSRVFRSRHRLLGLLLGWNDDEHDPRTVPVMRWQRCAVGMIAESDKAFYDAMRLLREARPQIYDALHGTNAWSWTNSEERREIEEAMHLVDAANAALARAAVIRLTKVDGPRDPANDSGTYE